jgi:hypothetical protein
MPKSSHRWRPLTGLAGVLVWVGAASGQGQPLPLPVLPGGAAPPIFSEPSPTAPTVTVPESYPRGGPSVGPPTGPAPGRELTPPLQRTPQITSFPELTRGIGNSETLLQE